MGFDQLTLTKFAGTLIPRFLAKSLELTSVLAEHEISGDVLLEMDVAMLKEIDLVAFGRRVHIYNAIKELRLRTQPPRALAASQSTAGSFIAPSMTGYEPDSPTSLAYSPSISALHQQNPQMRWQQQQLMQGGSSAGFGAEGDSAPTSLRAPSSVRSSARVTRWGALANPFPPSARPAEHDQPSLLPARQCRRHSARTADSTHTSRRAHPCYRRKVRLRDYTCFSPPWGRVSQGQNSPVHRIQHPASQFAPRLGPNDRRRQQRDEPTE
jgi:hypothetical protein